MTDNLESKAREWLVAVYTGDSAKVGELAAENVAISYPIFQQLFNKPVLRGKRAAIAFAERFATKWGEGKLTFHEVITVANRVVIVWEFSARNIGELQGSKPPTNELHSWGGITLIRFNENGKIVEEIGEESAPGPYGRLQT